jgi:hypothetical protein
MVNDTEARNAVRLLLRRFDLINAQRLSLAYVLAEQDSKEYARLLTKAEQAEKNVIRPKIGPEQKMVYAALDDPNADWPKAVPRKP